MSPALVFTLVCGCSSRPPARPVYNIGDRVVLGNLTYNVLETQWKSQLGAFPTVRMPQNSFLLVRITVTNGSGSDVNIPMLSLENSAGATFTELTDGSGVENWLGIVRQLAPADTDTGWIVFDVPTNSYRLKLTEPLDAGSSDSGPDTAFVLLPLNLQGRLLDGAPARIVPAKWRGAPVLHSTTRRLRPSQDGIRTPL
jgi:Domain of unknown function (DUF4352)